MDYGHKWTDKELEKLERRINAEYAQAQAEVQAKLDDYLRRFKIKDDIKRKALARGEITQKEYNRWRTGQIMIGKRWEEMRDSLAQDFHNTNLIVASMTRKFSYDAYAMNHNYGTYEAEKGALVDTSYTLYDRSTVERLIRDDPDMLPPPGKKVSQRIAEGKDVLWNKQQIQSVMTQSILQGESIPQIATRLANAVGDSNRKAAIRNARTMATGAENAGRVDSYKRAESMGIKMVQVWMATLDKRTRHEHRQLDGVKVSVGRPFYVDGYEIRFPGDPTAPGYLVYNCRCTLIGQVNGVDFNLSDTTQRNSRLGDMSYNEWRNEHSKLPKDQQLQSVSAQEFHDTIQNAKDSMPPSMAWRVDVHDVSDYANDSLYKTPGGSTVAVTPTGDIVSVCKNNNDTVSGSTLMERAVEMGGTKLDSYGGNHAFYTKNGFEPVSWCEWDDEQASDDWDDTRDKREPVVFYRYTGNKHKVNDVSEFTSRVPPSASYGEALEVRDKEIATKKSSVV